MMGLTGVSNSLLAPVSSVVTAVVEAAGSLAPHDVMLLGASCRDILHRALGHSFETTATRDLDLALAMASWDAYLSIDAAFSRVGDTGIRYRIAGFIVDLLPFGDVEDPPGLVEPPTRDISFSVWAFAEIFAASLPLALSPDLTIRIPTVAGFAAAKLGAWLDRSEYHETKDAADLALILYWYAESASVKDLLYETTAGNQVLIAEDADVQRATAHQLGADVADLVGPQRLSELLARWPGNETLMTRSLQFRGGPAWPADLGRRSELLDAFTRGLTASI